MMRVAILVEELGRSGGMAVIRQHARHLLRHGHHCELVVTGKARDVPDEDGGIPVRRLAAVTDEPVDIAMATWWTTTEALWDVDAHRRAVFLQNLEYRFYRPDDVPDMVGALGVLELPVDYVVIASHMVELLGAIREDARVHLATNGIDKRVFRPIATLRPSDAPLRVLVEGQLTLWHKGVPEAVAAVRAMSEPATVTVAVHNVADAGGVTADRVVGGLDPPEMAALYAEHDVLLKLARFEGLSLPALEAMHVGLPCVMTPFTGSEDYIQQGENGLVVPFDAPGAATAALDRLATEPELRERLRSGALATAARWPDADAASARFAAVLAEIAASDPPDPAPALRAMAHGRRRLIEQTREALRRADVRLDHARGEVAWWKHAWEQADAKSGEYDRWTQELQHRIEVLQARPAFRIEERLRRMGRR